MNVVNYVENQGNTKKHNWQIFEHNRLKPNPNDHMWLDFGKATEMSHWAYSILLAQLMATLIHYTFTLPLSGLVDWSAFLEQLLPTL